MNKLGNKEVIMVLVIVNVMLYYLLFSIGINPIKNKIKTNKENIEILQAEYDEKQAIVDSEDEIKQTIEALKAEKIEQFEKGFPNTDPENLHAFMVDEATNNHITINNISIGQSPRMVTDTNGEERESGIYDNDLTVNVKGTYLDVTNLVATVEDLQKTSILTSFSLNGEATEMTANLVYSFLSADKSEFEKEDPIFDHTFNNGAGDTALFK